MSKPTHALDFLQKAAAVAVPPVCVVFGDEPFLKSEVLGVWRASVLSGQDAEFSLTTVSGSAADLPELIDALSTVALFGSDRRLVIVEDAEKFVSDNRPQLEDYVQRPATRGVLVLDVKTWPGNTRLAKAVAETGLAVECKVPLIRGSRLDLGRMTKWVQSRSKNHYGVKIDPAAVEALLEMVEPTFGLLDQELAKLAPMAAAEKSISLELVQSSVGNWRTRQAWDMIDAALDGNAPEAIRQLGLLLLSGEQPVALLGQMGATLRRLAAAMATLRDAERAGRKISLHQALQQAGVHRFWIEKSERQLRQLGRPRAQELYHWLLDADLAIKGVSSSPARAQLVLEQLIVRMSSALDPRQVAVAGR